MGIIKYKFIEKKITWPFIVWSILAVAGIVLYIVLFSNGIDQYNLHDPEVAYLPSLIIGCACGLIGLMSIFLFIDAVIQYRLAQFKKKKIIEEALGKKEEDK